MNTLHCFHCHELIDQSHIVERPIQDKQQAFCCAGCASIASMIDSNGLSEFYEFRSESSRTANNVESKSYLIYDKKNIQQQYFTSIKPDTSHVQFILEDIRCAACIWLIKACLTRLSGVSKLDVDSISKIVSFEWAQDKTQLSEIMQQLDQVGYPPTPYCVENEVVAKNNYRNDILKRLGVAGLGMMQTMMFATGLYLGDSELTGTFNTANDLALSDRNLLQWVSLLVTSFVLWYSAEPFYKSAYRAARVGKVSMDMPISIALFIAYATSIYNILNNNPHVYFDTVTMFIFLILLGKLAEAQTRNYLARTLSSSKNKLPVLARKTTLNAANDSLIQTNTAQIADDWTPIVALNKNDLLLVKTGETIPVDGIIVDGETWLDQSFITGESTLIAGKTGQMALAGSINTHAPITLRAENLSGQRLIDQMIRFKKSGQKNKPRLEMRLDFIAKYFSLSIIAIALIVYLGWTLYQPDKALLVTLSVLVVSCPCALSLAVPTAQACTQYMLNKLGIAVAHHHFLETLLKTSDVLFDKTGTLTEGKISISDINFMHSKPFIHAGKPIDESSLLSIVGSLEAQSEHPIAQAFLPFVDPKFKASKIQYFNGEGIAGLVDDIQYYIGSPVFIDERVPSSRSKYNKIDFNASAEAHLVVASETGIIATITTADQTRKDAQILIDFLHQLNIKTHILSGDPSAKTASLSKQLGTTCFKHGMLAQEKMAYVENLSQQGRISLMIGDGINDAPVLSVAHNSIAMGTGSDLSRVSADAVLLNNQLSSLIDVFSLAQQHQKITTSNIYWALGYNMITIPMAIFGLIPPYLAAIGMSISSLVVLWNATRLLKFRQAEHYKLNRMNVLKTI
jgi:P-type Cu2+ transporter